MKLCQKVVCILLSVVTIFSFNLPVYGCKDINYMQISKQNYPLPSTIFFTDKWEFQTEETDSFTAELNLSSPEKKIPNLPSGNWQKIAVPSNWFLQGQDLEGVVWYRHKFRTNPSWLNQVVKLKFSGVDYAADVWLNGKYLGFHEGYFAPFIFQISDKLNTDDENVLLVRVNSPKEPAKVDWSLHKRLLKGIFGHHDTRPGGAWSERGQEQNTGGIWAPVSLEVSNQLAIDSVHITPNLQLAENQAEVRVDLAVNYQKNDTETVDLNFRIAPENFLGSPEDVVTYTQVLEPGVNQLSFNLPVHNPQLWWTWEHGKPNLYNLDVSINNDGQVLDNKSSIFGLRSIEYNQNEKVWKLNGKRFFIRGTNYIATQWLSEMDANKYAYDLALMKQGNINAIRVHAHIEAQEFYQQCDRAGILVWQDFPLQWGYIDTPEFIAEAIKQGKEMINLLYNHPSIIAWSLHNEPPWDSDWMKYKYSTYSYEKQQNYQLDLELMANLAPLDSTRYFHNYSTNGEHLWMGWYYGSWLDHGKPTKEPLITEFGAQALPNLPSLRRIFTEEELFPNTEAELQKWEYHNFQPYETFDLVKIPMGNNPQEFIDNTQQYQVKLTKLAGESYRRQRYQPVSAMFQFMFVEDWASINWGVVDYWRNPKPGYEALQTAYQPVLPSIIWQKEVWQLGEEVSLGLCVINDLWEAFPEAKLTYTISQNWEILQGKEISLEIQPDSLQTLPNISYQPSQKGNYQLVVKVLDSQGNVLGQNVLDFKVVGG